MVGTKFEVRSPILARDSRSNPHHLRHGAGPLLQLERHGASLGTVTVTVTASGSLGARLSWQARRLACGSHLHVSRGPNWHRQRHGASGSVLHDGVSTS
eukprot:506505-Rhodomonas_salina.1